MNKSIPEDSNTHILEERIRNKKSELRALQTSIDTINGLSPIVAPVHLVGSGLYHAYKSSKLNSEINKLEREKHKADQQNTSSDSQKTHPVLSKSM